MCVLDTDSTNAGLPQALGITDTPAPLIDYFGGMVFSGGAVTCPVDDPTPLPEAEISVDELPSEYRRTSPNGVNLLVAGKISDGGVGAGCDGPIGKIARDLRVHGSGDDPVTLVDFKAGFEDSARGIITGLDWAVVVVDPTVASVQMAADMRHLIYGVKSGELPATDHLEDPELIQIANSAYRNSHIRGVVLILNKIRDVGTERYLNKQLQGIRPIAVLTDDCEIGDAWLRGSPLEPDDLQLALRKAVLDLERMESPSPGTDTKPASVEIVGAIR